MSVRRGNPEEELKLESITQPDGFGEAKGVSYLRGQRLEGKLKLNLKLRSFKSA